MNYLNLVKNVKNHSSKKFICFSTLKNTKNKFLFRPQSAEDKIGEEVTKSLKRMLETMRTEVERSSVNISTATSSTKNLKGTTENYKKLSGTLDESRSLIRELWKNNRNDMIYIFGALGIFLATVAYVVIQRTPGIVWLPGKMVLRQLSYLAPKSRQIVDKITQITEDALSDIEDDPPKMFIDSIQEEFGSDELLKETEEVDNSEINEPEENNESLSKEPEIVVNIPAEPEEFKEELKFEKETEIPVIRSLETKLEVEPIAPLNNLEESLGDFVDVGSKNVVSEDQNDDDVEQTQIIQTEESNENPTEHEEAIITEFPENIELVNESSLAEAIENDIVDTTVENNVETTSFSETVSSGISTDPVNSSESTEIPGILLNLDQLDLEKNKNKPMLSNGNTDAHTEPQIEVITEPTTVHETITEPTTFIYEPTKTNLYSNSPETIEPSPTNSFLPIDQIGSDQIEVTTSVESNFISTLPPSSFNITPTETTESESFKYFSSEHDIYSENESKLEL